MVKPIPIVVANWKCNGSLRSNERLVTALNNANIKHNVECIIAPSFIHVPAVKEMLKNKTVFKIAAQNCIPKDGAFTGEISINMLKDQGIEWCIVGHSERREYLNESDTVVAQKVAACASAGIHVIVCVGERLKERENGRTATVVLMQLAAIASQVKETSWWDKIVLAYEPLWAIGTGKVATPQQAQEVHALLRQWLHMNYTDDLSRNVRILYGGSVNAMNAQKLYTMNDINGFLVGGTSLTPDFLNIINATS